jgi:hypothetical protein
MLFITAFYTGSNDTRELTSRMLPLSGTRFRSVAQRDSVPLGGPADQLADGVAVSDVLLDRE